MRFLILGIVLSLAPASYAGITPQLETAATSGDVAAIKAWLDAGGSPNETDPRGRTLASIAAAANRWDIVEIIMDRGFQPLGLISHDRANFQRGAELLVHAARYGKAAWIDRLLKAGIDLDVRKASQSHLEDPLCIALANKQHDIARRLVEAGAALNWIMPVREPDGWNSYKPIHFAVMGRSPDLLRLLIERGADIEAFTSLKMTPLMLAARENYVEGIELLLAAGASLEPRDLQRRQARDFATLPATRQALLKHQLGMRPGMEPSPTHALLLAIEADDAAGIRTLANPELVGAFADGAPPLHHAARWGRLGALRALIESGAAIDAPDSNGTTALYDAVENGRADSATLLVQSGANPNILSADGRLPLELALQRRMFELASVLISRGASVDGYQPPEGDWLPPLCWAVKFKQAKIVEMLLSKGAKVDARGSQGTGVLTFAVEAGDIATLGDFIDRGLDVNAADANGITPLAIAVATTNVAATELLLNAGAKPVALGRAMARLQPVGNPSGDRIRELLKNELGDKAKADEFWTSKPSRDQIIAYVKGGGSPNYREIPAPLWSALYKRDYELARLLLDHGADPNEEGAVQGKPLHVLAQSATRETEQEALEIARRMLDKGADPNGVTPLAGPPIGAAVRNGLAALVELLLQRGAGKGAAREEMERYGTSLPPDIQVRIRKLLATEFAPAPPSVRTMKL